MNVQKWVPKVFLKFHDDPTIKEYDLIVLLDKFKCIRERDRVLGEWKGKMNLKERKEEPRDVSCKN